MNFGTITKYGSVSVELLSIDGRLFKGPSGMIHRYSGVTAFPLIDMFVKGENIDSFLSTFSPLLANTLRVFWYTPVRDWGASAWSLPTASDVVAFHKYVQSRGWYVENVCLTDDDTSLLPQIRAIILALANSGLKNVLFEAKNEPFVHDSLDPAILKNNLVNTPYLYASGNNPNDNSSGKWIGEYVTHHTPRDNQEVRKSKDNEEISSGWRLPAVADEPSRPDQGYMNALDYYTYAALAALMGSGATFHFESGKFGEVPNSYELECAKMFFAGINLYPLDAQLGPYSHRQDLEKIVNNEPTACLRVFQKGNYAIIVRNKSVDIPSNWIPIDSYNVGFRIG
jgi:hypothetical protein